jgi:hypothetical protein
MSSLWMPSAKKFDLGDHGDCDPQYGAKAIAHITADRNASKLKPQEWVPFANLLEYFRNGGAAVAPHILWSPFTGDFAQFQPANSRSKSLRDLSGGIRTNRAGKVVIQIEAVFFPYCTYNGKTYAKLSDTPCKGWHELQDWVHSWGVPNTWPGGKPSTLSRDTFAGFASAAGWFGHSQVPENDHVDPGSWPSFIIDNPEPTKPKTIPAFPGSKYFYVGAYNNYVTEIDKNLVRLHFTKHNDGNGYQPGPRYTEYTKLNVSDFQKSRGWSGSGADGIVGPQTWHDLFAL